DPSAETPLCLTTLGGEIELTSARGVRRAKPEDFFVGALMTEREDDEMVSALILPVSPPGTSIGFKEINERYGDFAIVAAAAWATRDGAGFRYSLGLGGAEDRPFAVQGNTSNNTSAILEAVAEIVRDIEPLDDQRASASYRRHLASYLGGRVLQQAIEAAA
ncbi:MAG: carbon monoxide dehydrogenase, partial [Pseudomonadota bacterium]|nr:carbon monoxide dehydrogenase [Pseudomonadota bacterium]